MFFMIFLFLSFVSPKIFEINEKALHRYFVWNETISFFYIHDSIFSKLTTRESNGGAFCYDNRKFVTKLNITKCLFDGCSALDFGGAIYFSNQKGVVSGRDICFFRCHSGNGIAFSIYSTNVAFEQIKISNEGARYNSEYLFYSIGTELYIKSSNFSNNRNKFAGFNLHFSYNGNSTIEYTVFFSIVSLSDWSFSFEEGISFVFNRINVIQCVSASKTQIFFDSVLNRIMKNSVMLKSPYFESKLVCIDCYFDTNLGSNSTYIDCKTSTIGPTYMSTFIACYYCTNLCKDFSGVYKTKFVIETISTCYNLINSLFIECHSSSSGGSVNIIAPYVILTVNGCTFRNSSAYRDDYYIIGGAICVDVESGSFFSKSCCYTHCFSGHSHMGYFSFSKLNKFLIEQTSINYCSYFYNSLVNFALYISGGNVSCNCTKNNANDSPSINSIDQYILSYSIISHNYATSGSILTYKSGQVIYCVFEHNHAEETLFYGQFSTFRYCSIHSNIYHNAIVGNYMGNTMFDNCWFDHFENTDMVFTNNCVVGSLTIIPISVFNEYYCFVTEKVESSGIKIEPYIIFILLFTTTSVVFSSIYMTMKKKQDSLEASVLIDRTILVDFG